MQREVKLNDPISFEIIKEDWNEYIVHDVEDVPVKGRVIITKIFTTEEVDAQGKPVYIPGYQNIFATFAPKSLFGEPTKGEINDDERIKHITEELEFDSLKETWNEYKLADGNLLRFKMVVSAFQKTSLFSLDGNPLYNVNSQPVLRVIVAP